MSKDELTKHTTCASAPVERKYRMQTWGRTTYGFAHNDGKRMVFVDQFREGWRYGTVSIEKVHAELERMSDEPSSAYYIWLHDTASSSQPYPTRKAAIQAALESS